MEKKNTNKWISIVSNHCEMYFPSFKAVKNTYNLKHKEVANEGLPNEFILDNFYACPLCLSNFILVKDQGLCATHEFDKDHYPPKSVSGSKTILVCKSCNSKYGKEFDYSIKSYLNLQAFLKKKKSSVGAKLSLSNTTGIYSTGVHWENNMLITEVNSKKYPLFFKGLENAAKKRIQDLCFNLKLSFPAEELIHKAFLKAAYLKCFAHWGYEFAWSEIGRNIIEVLDGKIKHPLSNLGVFKEETLKPLEEGLYCVECKDEFSSFMYVCKGLIKDVKEESNIFILIPRLTESPWEKFKFFEKLIPKGEFKFQIWKVINLGIHDKENLGYSKSSSYYFQ